MTPKRRAFVNEFCKRSFTPTTRSAGSFPNGRKLPFFHLHNLQPVVFDAKAHGDPVEISAAEVDDDQWVAVSLGRTSAKKAYGMVEVQNKPIISLFDTGSEGDVISYDLYHRMFRPIPLEKVKTYIRGIDKNSRSDVEGRITLRVTIGHRKVKIPFLVVKNVTQDMIIGFPTQTALGIDTITTEQLFRITSPGKRSGRKRTNRTSTISMIDPNIATAARSTKLRAAEDFDLETFHERINFPVRIDSSQNGNDLKLQRLSQGKRTVLVDSSPLSGLRIARGFAVADDGCLNVTVANISRRKQKIKKGSVIGTVCEMDIAQYNCLEIFEPAYDPTKMTRIRPNHHLL